MKQIEIVEFFLINHDVQNLSVIIFINFFA